MKKIVLFLIDIKKLIKLGVLRIFPKQSLYLGILAALIMVGCCAEREIADVIHEVRSDTFRNDRFKHDSVFVGHERMVERKHDTVFIEDVTVEYRYRVVCDTVRIVKCDTIPFEHKIEMVKKEPYVPTMYKISFIVLSIIVVSLILYYLWRKLF